MVEYGAFFHSKSKINLVQLEYEYKGVGINRKLELINTDLHLVTDPLDWSCERHLEAPQNAGFRCKIQSKGSFDS